jgi:hypothetical protein
VGLAWIGLGLDEKEMSTNHAGISKSVPNPERDQIGHILEWKEHMLNENLSVIRLRKGQ